MDVRSNLTRDLATLWTTQDLVNKFGVTSMTLWVWRTKRGLPHLQLPGKKRAPVRFIPDEVRAWAAKEGIKIRK